MTYQEICAALRGEQMKKEAGMRKEALTGKGKAIPFLRGILRRTATDASRRAMYAGIWDEAKPAWDRDNAIFQLGKLMRAKAATAPGSQTARYFNRIIAGRSSAGLGNWDLNNAFRLKPTNSKNPFSRLFERL